MIRVALIAHLSELSGAGTALVEKARGLNPAEFETLLVLPGNGPLKQYAEDRGLTVHIVPNVEAALSAKLRNVFQRIGYVRRLRHWLIDQRIDIAFINTTANIFPGIAARLAGIPIFWMVHEVLENPGRVTRFKMRAVRRLANAMAWDSYLGQTLFPAPANTPHIVVTNCVDSERFPYTANRLAQPPYTIICNGLFPRKGADLFLQAAKLLPQYTDAPCKFVLVGLELTEMREFISELREFAQCPELRGKVEFAGIQKDMPRLLAQTDIMVSASRNEAWPIIILEAMASGVPVVATNVGDCRLIIGEADERGLLIAPEDPQAISRAIAQCLNQPTETTQRAAHANQWVRENCAGDDYWQPLENLLRQIAK